MTFVVCQILNITYSASFGFLAGIFNFIPIIGPLVIGLLIFIVAGLDSWLKGIFFLIAFSLIQQIENNILYLNHKLKAILNSVVYFDLT